ncbi:MAG: hypothetical protein IJ512_08770, partial [Ruminococcus sp.]|nr:hypothetical protein [Ruminococcus sp.]
MKIPMLDSLLEQYNDLSERTQSELSTMLNVVSGKYIPGTSQISTISDSLNQLYEMYEQIYDSVQTMLPEEEMPSKEKSVSELIETLVSSKMQLLDRARAVLSRFTCVEAVSEAYSQAIAPYQQEAELMLGKAENPEEIVIDEVAVISEAAFAPEIFLQALDTDDFDTDDEIELLEQVGQYYPLRVQVGLAQKKFFQTTAPEETQSEKPSDILSEEVQPEEACSFPDGGEPESDSCVPDAGTEAGEQPLSEANEPEILPEAIEAEPETSDLSDEEKKLPASELEEAPVSEEESADEAAEPKSAPEHEPVLVGVVPADHTAAFQGIVSEIIPETEEPVEEPVEEPEEETAETGTKEDETEETSETVTSAYETEEERDDADDDNDNDEEDRAVDIHIDGLPEYMEQLCEHISESHTFTEYKSKKAEKSFGVKSFKSDLKGPSLALRVIVMNDIFNNVCIDEERIAFMNKQPLFKLSAEAECEYLCNKGYLKKYVLDDEKSMYCLTGKGLKAYASKDSASFLKMKKAKDRTELEISTSESAILHLLYAKGIVHAAESEANGTDTAISCTRSEKSFIYRVTPKDGTPHIYTALLEQEMDEISTYFLNLSEHIQETDSAQISILGYNCEHAEHIRSVLEKAQLCSVSSIYSFVDDRWYGGGGSDPSPEPENTLEDEENVPDPEETACTEEMSSLTEELQPENTEPKETVETEMVTCTKELPDASSESEDAEEDTKAVSDSEKDLETEITTPEKSADENETEVSVAAAPEMKKILPEKEDAPEETVVPQPEPEKIEVSAEQTAAAAEEGEDEEAVPTEEMLSDESELEPLPEEADKSRQEITDICMSMICADKLYCASAYLKTMSLWKPEIQPMYKQLAYAINDPLEENCSYTSAALIDIFYSTLDETGVMSDYCLASALIRNYFMDHIRYDYNMQSLQDIAKNNAVICGNSNLNQIVYELYQFKENSKSGADRYADYRVKEKMEMEVKLNDIIREANEYYTNYIEGNIVERGSHKRFIHTQRLVFAKDG